MKRVVLTSVRFKKKLVELNTKGYMFEQEIILCDKNIHFNMNDQFFKDTKVEDSFKEYPIREVGLYFVNEEENTMCLVDLEASEDSLGRMSTSIGGIGTISSSEKYYIELGQTVPEKGLEGELIDTFELRSKSPMFFNFLLDSILKPDEDIETEFADELLIEPIKETDPIPSMYEWKYKSVMLNNDVHEALFRFRDIDLNILLSDLKTSGYELVSLGLIDVRSITDSVTVCVFKNNKGYSYISFFYGVEEEEFMVKIQSKETKLKRIKINGKYVPLVNVSISNSEDTSTLIQGFDFENFQEYNLAF